MPVHVCARAQYYIDSTFLTVTTAVFDVEYTPAVPTVFGDASIFTDIIGFNEPELQDFAGQAMYSAS